MPRRPETVAAPPPSLGASLLFGGGWVGMGVCCSVLFGGRGGVLLLLPAAA